MIILSLFQSSDVTGDTLQTFSLSVPFIADLADGSSRITANVTITLHGINEVQYIYMFCVCT